MTRPPCRMLAIVLTGAAFLSASASRAADHKRDVPWSFAALVTAEPPAVRDKAWPRDDIDRFILARLDAAALKPNPDADRTTLIRRASFDLLGLPPTMAEVDAFTRDSADHDKAFAKVVDRLLASPRFGERWGRHWLDVARYADSSGRSWNAPFTYAWRYRDWVIAALNKDKPYDQFIREQIAGDLLPRPASIDDYRAQLIATGFLALGAADLVQGSREQFALDRIDDQIEVTTRAVLSLTVACARCHDHKYDPIATADYYALAGVFYSTRTLSGQGARSERNLEYVDGAALINLPGPDGKPIPRQPGGVHSMSDVSGGGRGTRFTTDPNLAMGVTEAEPRDCAVRIKGVPEDIGPTPRRGDLHIPGLPPLPAIPSGASGRLEFARWLTSADNPLTARVMVNRVWQHLFGQGLVPTPDDFGSTGEPPTHPELLDHLARRFIDNGWSTKRLIRTIMLSRAYRLGSAGQPAARAKDPTNELLWRMNLRRLELEPLRDTLLMAAGRLTLEPPAGIQVAGIGGKGRDGATRSLLAIDAPCRTVYLPVLRSLLPDVYGTFDFPDPCQIMGRREITTVGTQALFFMNGDLAVDCSRDAADLLLAQRVPNETERIRMAYRGLLSRAPTRDEITDAMALLSRVRPATDGTAIERHRWATLVQAIAATAEFRYVR